MQVIAEQAERFTKDIINSGSVSREAFRDHGQNLYIYAQDAYNVSQKPDQVSTFVQAVQQKFAGELKPKMPTPSFLNKL